MKRNYTLEWKDGTPVVWEHYGVAPSIRVFEDGVVAEEHAVLASRLQQKGLVTVRRHASYAVAQEFMKSSAGPQFFWFHHFTLSGGYHDRYPYEERVAGSEV